MNSYECYLEYLALKRHFQEDSYDYVKFNGKVNARVSAFEKRNDKHFFLKVSKHPQAKDLLLANLLYYPTRWIGDIAGEDGARTLLHWQKKQESLSYEFKQELGKLRSPLNANLSVEDNNHPYIVKLFLSGQISLETLTIIVDMTGCYAYWDKRLDDPVYEDVRRLVLKYARLLKYDRKRMAKIVLDVFA